MPHPAHSTLFPYTTLFRSAHDAQAATFFPGVRLASASEASGKLEPLGEADRERRPHSHPRLHLHGAAVLADDPLPLRRSEEHTSELQSHSDLVCRLLLEKK